MAGGLGEAASYLLGIGRGLQLVLPPSHTLCPQMGEPGRGLFTFSPHAELTRLAPPLPSRYLKRLADLLSVRGAVPLAA